MAIVTSSHLLSISEMIILQKTRHYFHVACFTNKACKTKSYHPNHLFSSVNLLASRPHDVKLCLHLIYFMLTSTPSTAKCEPGFSAMNHLECNLRTTLVKNALSHLMQMHSSDHAMKADQTQLSGRMMMLTISIVQISI